MQFSESLKWPFNPPPIERRKAEHVVTGPISPRRGATAVRYFNSTGTSDLPYPTRDAEEVGTVFMHSNYATGKRQIWLCDRQMQWTIIPYPNGDKTRHITHPEDITKYFNITPAENRPTWVLFATLERHYHKQVAQQK